MSDETKPESANVSEPENAPESAKTTSEAPETLASEGQVKKPVIRIGTQRPGHEIKLQQTEKAPSLEDSLAQGPSATPATAPAPVPASDVRTESGSIQGGSISGGSVSGGSVSGGSVQGGSVQGGSVESADTDGEGDAAAFPPPRIQKMSDDVQAEFDAALAGLSMDDLLAGDAGTTEKDQISIDSKYTATVVKVDREYVFYSLPGHHEGAVGIKHFEDELPEVGAEMEVTVTGFKPDERMYELGLPGATIEVSDWSDIDQGSVVEATITGHNTGGLECTVGSIRGFMPISQIALFRVEDCSEFVGQKLRSVITEANPARGNLVLSHRALLEREREAAREELMSKLEAGQEHEGIVRKIMDFGAFVDIGGVDGLIHISKLSWDRIKHPSEVLTEGEKVKIKIEKIDEETGKLSFSYRDLLEGPWDDAEAKFPVNDIVTGTVSKIMPFGAFIRIASGVEGLVHISEVAHHRVTRVDNVVREGEEVTVKILSIDEDEQKMSLSIKGAQVAPASKTEQKEDVEDETPPPPLPKSNKPLMGGLNKPTGGEGIGLNW